MGNKSILIIDTPENCDKCRICARAEIDDYCAYLGARNGEFIYPNGYAELSIGMSNCPLRPLPEEKHRDTRFDDIAGAIDYGWNSCLAALEGKDMIDKLIEHADKILEGYQEANKEDLIEVDTNYIYRTHFKLNNPVLDVLDAQYYLGSSNMTRYLRTDYEYEDLKDDIISIEWYLEDKDSGYIELRTIRKFTEGELERISNWVSGQNSDGLGEGFEQQDFASYIMRDGKLLDFNKDEWYDEDLKTAEFDWETNKYKFELVD